MQKQMNDEMLSRLKVKYPHCIKLQELEKALNSLSDGTSKNPNPAILLSTQFIQSENGYPGVDCFGGKDRTGYQLAAITFSKIVELTGLDKSHPEMVKIGHRLLRPEGVAGRVAQDNADHTTLKVLDFDLELYHVDSAKGKLLRIAHGINSLALALWPMFKSWVGFDPWLVSSTPHQLYHPSPTKVKVNQVYHHTVPSETRITVQE